MSVRVQIHGVILELGDDLVWRPGGGRGPAPEALARVLTSGYGIDWIPGYPGTDTLCYIPNALNARAEAAANAFGGIVVKFEEPRNDVPGRVY